MTTEIDAIAPSPRRAGIRPPKFADKFALLDFDADPMPVISMFEPPAPFALDELSIEVRGEDLRPRMVRWPELSRLPLYDANAALVCQIFNWFEVVRWHGVLLSDFLHAASLDVPASGYFAFQSQDGQYFETLSRDEARDPRTMLAFGMNGAPLPHEYGGPLRLVVPFLQGYKSVKWLSRIHAYRHDPSGIKQLLGQSKSGALGQAWMDRLGIEPCAASDAAIQGEGP
jgi:DMSO/TMAO reductase YedYZ molybdopterin-dependent catalytic subunit